jgi:hypothetical protein
VPFDADLFTRIHKQMLDARLQIRIVSIFNRCVVLGGIRQSNPVPVVRFVLRDLKR